MNIIRAFVQRALGGARLLTTNRARVARLAVGHRALLGGILVQEQGRFLGMSGYFCTASVSEPDAPYPQSRRWAGSDSLTLAVRKSRSIPEHVVWSCTRLTPTSG